MKYAISNSLSFLSKIRWAAADLISWRSKIVVQINVRAHITYLHENFVRN